MKILNFGSCNIDYVYSLDHIVKIGETETTHKLETYPGGKGLNQSIAVAKAGVDYIQLLDQNHGGTPYFCYSRKHNHPPVPGKCPEPL